MIIDRQMKGTDIENDQDENLSKPYQLSDIGNMLPVFTDMLSVVDNFMQIKLSPVVFFERSGATERNQELQVSNCRVH